MSNENLYDNIPAVLPDELFTSIHRADHFRIERIVSQGQSSPDDFWYDQDEHEWILVLEGSAVVQIEGEPEPLQLHRGSYMNIPAHKKHRVVQTSQTEQTIWLAIHYDN
jgi:cupin 2 domain-containing protein